MKTEVQDRLQKHQKEGCQEQICENKPNTRQRKPKVKKPKGQQKDEGGDKLRTHWDLIQQTRYVKFLQKNRELYDLSLSKKKETKVHIKLSTFVKTRSSTQCRSHHQKMLIRYKSIDNIINAYEQLAQYRFERKNNSLKKDQEPHELSDEEKEPDIKLEEQFGKREYLEPQPKEEKQGSSEKKRIEPEMEVKEEEKQKLSAFNQVNRQQVKEQPHDDKMQEKVEEPGNVPLYYPFQGYPFQFYPYIQGDQQFKGWFQTK